MSTIRSSGIGGFAPIVAGLGGDPAALAHAVGLDPAALDDDDTPIPDWRLAELLEIAAVEIGCPDLGLQMANRHGLDMLGPLAVVLVNSATGADALDAAARYLAVHASAIAVEAVPDPYGDPSILALRYSSHPGGPAPIQATDAGLGFLHRALTLLLGSEDYGLHSVELPYHPVAPVSRYEEFYRARVRVGRPEAMLRVSADITTRPIAGADEEVRRQAVAYLESLLPTGAEDWAGRSRVAIAEALALTPVTLASVARLLAVHERTLQRRLRDEGTSFAEILDDVRRQWAHRLLTQGTTPFHEISTRLGFAEQATLTRSCRRWWGTTPREVRRLSP